MEKITAVAKQLTGGASLSQSPPIPQNGDASSAHGVNERRSSPQISTEHQEEAPGEASVEAGLHSAEVEMAERGDSQTVEPTDEANISAATPNVDTPASEASSTAEKEDMNGKHQESTTATLVDRPPPLARPSSALVNTDAAPNATSIDAAGAAPPLNNAGTPAGKDSADMTTFERPTPPLRPKTTIPAPAHPTSPTIANLIQSSTNSLSTPQRANGAAETVLAGDQMDVDDTHSPAEDGPSEPSVGQLVAQEGTRGKTLHTVLLLRDLLRFLRYPSGEVEQGIPTTSTIASTGHSGPYPSVLEARARYASLEGEEPMTVDQRLDVLAHASVALAKVLYSFRGKELETRIDSLDRRLQQQFERLWKPGDHPLKEPEPQARILDEKEVQTSEIPSSSQAIQTMEELKVVEPIKPPPFMTSQGVQAMEEERILETTGIQTEPVLASEPLPTLPEPETPIRLLSPDTTMVDVSQPSPEVDVIVTSSKLVPSEEPERRPPVSGAVASIMRSMADLLESASRDSFGVVRSAKGKEREVDMRDVEMGEGYADSPILAALMNELKSMKDELRENQQRSREEIVAIRMLHRSEVDTLKGQMEDKEHQGRQELEELQRRHGEELDQVRDTIQTLTNLKEKRESVEEGPRMPPIEILELSRRITTLESRSRTDSFADSNSPAPQSSPATIRASEPPTTIHQLSNSHPLAHLMPSDPDESNSLPSPRTGRPLFTEFSVSKPGTPVSSDRPSNSTRHLDGMDVEESIPLPIKTQRKMHMMMFQRPPG
jgi:hypothetical protein